MSSKRREKVEEAVKALEAIKFESGGRISFGDLVRFNNTIESLKSALAEPPRNCDVGTAYEQQERFWGFCSKYHKVELSGRTCRGCPLEFKHDTANEASCDFIWLHMPYKKEGEE